MSRTFQDAELLTWETYAAAPRTGRGREGRTGARIVFHCLTDRTRRARVLERDDSRAAVEGRIAGAKDEELADLLAAAAPLD